MLSVKDLPINQNHNFYTLPKMEVYFFEKKLDYNLTSYLIL